MNTPKPIISLNFFEHRDPLFKELIFRYFSKLEKEFEPHFITFEQKDGRRTEESYRIAGAQHYPIFRKDGRFLLIKRLSSFLQTLKTIRKIKRSSGAKTVLALAANSAMLAAPICKILGLKLVVFSMEPQSEYMIESGTWSKNGLKSLLGKRLEKYILRSAAVLFVNSDFAVNQYSETAKGKVLNLPVSIDPELHNFDLVARNTLRKNHGFADKKIFVYGGKFGGLYYSAETFFNFWKSIISSDSNYQLLVISPEESRTLRNIAKACDFPRDQLTLLPRMHASKFSQWMSAADIGIVGIPSSPLQRFRSPVKTSFYWLNGLPVFVSKNVGEDDLIVQKTQTGIVSEDWRFYLKGEKDFAEILSQINAVLSQEKTIQAAHCRAVGLESRNFERVLEAFRAYL